MRSVNIAGAYLKSEMKDSEITVPMMIDADMTKLLCQLDPTYKDYLTNKGEVIVQLDRALYGICEAGLMRYKNISATLLAIGYVQNEYDQCVFNKVDPEGIQII